MTGERFREEVEGASRRLASRDGDPGKLYPLSKPSVLSPQPPALNPEP